MIHPQPKQRPKDSILIFGVYLPLPVGQYLYWWSQRVGVVDKVVAVGLTYGPRFFLVLDFGFLVSPV
jgi:hypothetical protein